MVLLFANMMQIFLLQLNFVIVATSVKQAICFKQACILFLKKAIALKLAYIKQAPGLSKHILIIL